MNRSYLILAASFLLFSCTTTPSDDQLSQWKKEVTDAEKAFADQAMAEGINEAFLAFVAEDGVLMRNNAVIEGKETIRGWFDARPQDPNTTLVWSPDFVDVAASGDLAYTYGKYTYTTLDSLGSKQEYKGIFHTVWKRQSDGSWKFVWD